MTSTRRQVGSRAPDAKPDRRAALADAAIEVLAEQGARGLTHRAVDARLGLPHGSTSYYFRTRGALLAAVAARLVELDQGDLEASGGKRAAAAALLTHWLSPERRSRLVARFELFVASARPGDPRPLAAARESFIEQAAGGFRRAGVQGARAAAITLIAVQEGLLLNELLGTGLRPAERARALDAVLASLAGRRTSKRQPPHRS